MKKLISVSLVSLCLAVAGCAVQPAAEEGASRSSTDPLSTTTSTWVSIHYNPTYNDYTVKDLNGTAYAYVYDLDWSQSGLAQNDIDKVYAAPEGEIVFYGVLGAYSYAYGERNYVVKSAYLGMPGKTPATGEIFYHAAHQDITCITAPCNTETAYKLNSTTTRAFAGYDVSRASFSFVDQTWLTARVEFHDAIVAGKFTATGTFPGGTAYSLDASQVYVKLGEMQHCPTLMQPNCPSGQVATFKRNADRCVVFDQCVTAGICPLFMPSCNAGYTLASWKTAPSACNGYACDPTFVNN
jgi:hypothetical protein